MAALVGYGGSVALASNAVARLKQWEAPLQRDLYDVTEFGDQWKDYLPGLAGSEPKLDGFFDPGDTNGQVALVNAWLNGTSVTLNLSLEASPPHAFSGTAYVKELDIKTPVNGPIEFKATMAYTGAITYS